MNLTLRERAERRLAPILSGLPPALQVKLSGGEPLLVDGSTLDPGLQVIFAARVQLGAKQIFETPLEESRRRILREALVHAGPADPAQVRDLQVPGADGPLPARLYAPAHPDPEDLHHGSGEPLLFFLHGGGFVVGDLATYDPVCRSLAAHGRIRVLSVAYRLAPESPFPAAVEDAEVALDWTLSHAGELGADPGRVAAGGDSAGANLATVAIQDRVQRGLSGPVLQWLVYPTVDRTCVRPSHELFGQRMLLTRDEMEWCQALYMGESATDIADPRISPILGPLQGLPPTLITTAGFDPLRDEGEAYAARLREADVPVQLCRFDALAHGFLNMAGVSPACREASIELARELGRRLGARP